MIARSDCAVGSRDQTKAMRRGQTSGYLICHRPPGARICSLVSRGRICHAASNPCRDHRQVDFPAVAGAWRRSRRGPAKGNARAFPCDREMRRATRLPEINPDPLAQWAARTRIAFSRNPVSNFPRETSMGRVRHCLSPGVGSLFRLARFEN